MTLSVWQRETGTPTKKIADLLCVTTQAISLWKAGKRFPRPEHLRAIEGITGGRVCSSDFLATYNAFCTVASHGG